MEKNKVTVVPVEADVSVSESLEKNMVDLEEVALSTLRQVRDKCVCLVGHTPIEEMVERPKTEGSLHAMEASADAIRWCLYNIRTLIRPL